MRDTERIVNKKTSRVYHPISRLAKTNFHLVGVGARGFCLMGSLRTKAERKERRSSVRRNRLRLIADQRCFLTFFLLLVFLFQGTKDDQHNCNQNEQHRAHNQQHTDSATRCSRVRLAVTTRSNWLRSERRIWGRSGGESGKRSLGSRGRWCFGGSVGRCLSGSGC